MNSTLNILKQRPEWPGAAMRLAYTGHGSNTGGLQRHSVGDSYPFTVVGTMHRMVDEPVPYTRYYVLNCANGDRYYIQGKNGDIRTFMSPRIAHAVANSLAEGKRDFKAGLCDVVKL